MTLQLFSRAWLFILLTTVSPTTSWAQEACSDIFSANQFKGNVTSGTSAYGPSLFYKADPSLRGPLPKKLTFGTYNFLNLYDHHMGQGPVPKLEAKIEGNARAVDKISPDFMTGEEIENITAQENFISQHLKNQYVPLLIPGNDHRIQVGLFVKKDLPIEMEWRSFKNFSFYPRHNVFSRDLPVGIVYERDSNGLKKNVAKFIIIATHYKSKRTAPGQKDTAQVRAEQIRATVEVMKLVQKEFGELIPIVLSGDFNNGVHTSPEFRPLFNLGFKDTLDLISQRGSPEQRATHYYFSNDGTREANQMDAILILGNKKMKVLKSHVIADTDAEGRTLPAPRTFEEREERPSDHRAIAAEIEIQ